MSVSHRCAQPFEAGWRPLGDALVRTRPAPPFDLTDQAGRPVSLEGLAGRVLIVNVKFIVPQRPHV